MRREVAVLLLKKCDAAWPQENYQHIGAEVSSTQNKRKDAN